jgi:hypothetical protein
MTSHAWDAGYLIMLSNPSHGITLRTGRHSSKLIQPIIDLQRDEIVHVARMNPRKERVLRKRADEYESAQCGRA